MGIKEETKEVVTKLIGPVNGEKVLGFNDSDPKAFIESSKQMIANVLGESIAETNLKPIYEKYAN